MVKGRECRRHGNKNFPTWPSYYDPNMERTFFWIYCWNSMGVITHLFGNFQDLLVCFRQGFSTLSAYWTSGSPITDLLYSLSTILGSTLCTCLPHASEFSLILSRDIGSSKKLWLSPFMHYLYGTVLPQDTDSLVEGGRVLGLPELCDPRIAVLPQSPLAIILRREHLPSSETPISQRQLGFWLPSTVAISEPSLPPGLADEPWFSVIPL